MKKTLGGDRLGSGKKMQVELHGYSRSTHDLSYLWRSTMSAGTLVPFLTEVALPGDTFDINLDCDIKTHPTVGPLFGSYKVQLDIFLCPVRLYQGQLHNNKLGIGMDMASVKLPIIELAATVFSDPSLITDIDNSQINPSCILNYLGIRGVGINIPAQANVKRWFNAIPLLAYWEIYKNYYSNKQEEKGAVIHTPPQAIITSVNVFDVWNGVPLEPPIVIPFQPAPGSQVPIPLQRSLTQFTLNYSGGTPPLMHQVLLIATGGQRIPLNEIIAGQVFDDGVNDLIFQYNYSKWGYMEIVGWDYLQPYELPVQIPQVKTFNLSQIDDMREQILATAISANPFSVNAASLEPYEYVLGATSGFNHMLSTQEGLALKTYQSDLFNNWLNTEMVTSGISDITAIDTSGGSFTIDTLNLSKKVYDMLNRIAVSGGTYDDWLDAVYTHDRFNRIESPVYQGGLIKELVFQEVISNSSTSPNETTTGSQPLGTLAGKGIMSKKHKGGQIVVKVDEPSYIIGIVSLTPRIDYSQGNKWDTHLLTMDDFHKPALDQIGFQDLITEQMAWWSTQRETNATFITKSAGKQPAWINYMTNVNRTYGNFAIKDNEMFMTLNRRYEADPDTFEMTDLTTYIDPSKFNHIFADTALDAQNFWTQIAVDMTARRKMSAKIMPNL